MSVMEYQLVEAEMEEDGRGLESIQSVMKRVNKAAMEGWRVHLMTITENDSFFLMDRPVLTVEHPLSSPSTTPLPDSTDRS